LRGPSKKEKKKVFLFPRKKNWIGGGGETAVFSVMEGGRKVSLIRPKENEPKGKRGEGKDGLFQRGKRKKREIGVCFSPRWCSRKKSRGKKKEKRIGKKPGAEEKKKGGRTTRSPMRRPTQKATRLHADHQRDQS